MQQLTKHPVPLTLSAFSPYRQPKQQQPQQQVPLQSSSTGQQQSAGCNPCVLHQLPYHIYAAKECEELQLYVSASEVLHNVRELPSLLLLYLTAHSMPLLLSTSCCKPLKHLNKFIMPSSRKLCTLCCNDVARTSSIASHRTDSSDCWQTWHRLVPLTSH
jgi:hypothetical protein